jgi:hypothetical protein
VRSSTRRIHTLATTTTSLANATHQSARDIYLLKHMLFIFVVFLIGWLPIYTVPLLQLNEEMILWVYQILQILPVISSIVIVVDLFLYNRDLTQYLRDKFFKRFRINRN